MPKRIANGLTLLSAVVCVGSAMLVGRSFLRIDHAGLSASRHLLTVTTGNGRITLTHRDDVALHPTSPYFKSVDAGIAGWRWTGFGLHGGIEDELTLPLWLLPLLTAIPPVRWWRARRREGGRGFAVEAAA